MNYSISTVGKVWNYSGGIHCDARQKKNTLQWSMIVEHRIEPIPACRSLQVLTETGGLLRVAVKLMMACASQNVNVLVAYILLRDKRLRPRQGLCPSGQFNWGLLSDQGRLHEPSKQRGSFYLGGQLPVSLTQL